MAIRAVAFDLDYTLAVPERDRETILAEAAEAAGAPALTRGEYLETHQENLTEETREPVFEALLADRETDADPAEVARAYRELITAALEPVPGVEAMLTSLAESYRIGLLTNGPSVAQRTKIRTLGWEDLFDAALVTGELSAGKPDVAAFEALLDALGTAPEETVFIGDRVDDDIGGATAAGLVPIQVLFDGGPDPDPQAAAFVERENLAERLPDLLAEL